LTHGFRGLHSWTLGPRHLGRTSWSGSLGIGGLLTPWQIIYPPRTVPGDLFPPARSYFIKEPEPPKIVSPAKAQTPNIWAFCGETLHMQTMTDAEVCVQQTEWGYYDPGKRIE
jgi:hypothetical protein